MGNVLILAGGAGSRLAGREHPKALFRIGIKPVIELLIDQILRFFPDATVWVVTKEEWRKDFERWVDAYATRRAATPANDPSIQPVHLVSEDTDLDPALMPNLRGTLPAVYRTLQWLRVGRKINDGEVFHVVLADNYFDENTDADQPNSPSFFNALKQRELSLPNDPRCRGVVATYELSNSRDASKYGVIRCCEDRPWIKELIEKPPHPRWTDRLVSIGYYLFRNDADTVRDWGKYLTTWQDNPRSQENDSSVNPDIAFWIDDQIRQQVQPCADSATGHFCCLKFEGAWFDVGTPDDLLRATSDYIARHFDAIRTIGDLQGRAHRWIADQYFVYARPQNLRFNGSTLEIAFHPTDPIAREKPKPAPNTDPWLQWIARFVALPLSQRKDGAVPPLPSGPETAASRLFFSGGVLLIDTSNQPDELMSTESTIPFQRRDFGARMDPDRLTMPAGGLDSLSLTECCYSEMQEEIICYGERRVGAGGRVLFYLEPFVPGLQLTQEGFLEHVADAIGRGIQIPGIDPVSIDQARSDRAIRQGLIEQVNVYEHNLSRHRGQGGIWEIVLTVGDKVMDRGWFFVSVDLTTKTLECRKVAVANLSYFTHSGGSIQSSPNLLYGRLGGIADGEGFGRLPLLYRADALIGYMNALNTLNRDQITGRLLSGPDLLRVQCSGRAGSGRFERFGFDAPIAVTTKTVGDMLRFLPNLF